MTAPKIPIASIDAVTFTKEVNELIVKEELGYLEAVLEWCQRHEVEVEYAASLVKRSRKLRSFVQEEAENLKLIKKSGRLPV